MHFFALVIIPPDGDVEQHVTKMMAPYDENTAEYDYDKEEWIGTEPFWDFWQIGGRMCGVYSDYDPQKDPINRDLGANPLMNNGVKWPTQWAQRLEHDVMPVAKALEWAKKKFPPFTLLAPETLIHKVNWHIDNGEDNEHDTKVMKILENLAGTNMRAVVVDYHS